MVGGLPDAGSLLNNVISASSFRVTGHDLGAAGAGQASAIVTSGQLHARVLGSEQRCLNKRHPRSAVVTEGEGSNAKAACEYALSDLEPRPPHPQAPDRRARRAPAGPLRPSALNPSTATTQTPHHPD